MKSKMTKVAPSSNIEKINNPVVVTDIDDSIDAENVAAGEDTRDV